ncbi:MAG: SelT/SelW/SelH family protein [Cypionkella sp.]|nr:SelT/SelW/SelH family protein [Cypionkella sp.]
MSDIKGADATKPAITLSYCTQCNWLLRTAWMAQELLSSFGQDLGSVTLIPATGGLFQITLDGKVIWDRKEMGGFPDVKVLKQWCGIGCGRGVIWAILIAKTRAPTLTDRLTWGVSRLKITSAPGQCGLTSARYFKMDESNAMLISLRQTHFTEQAGTPMAVVGETPLSIVAGGRCSCHSSTHKYPGVRGSAPAVDAACGGWA